MINVLIADNNKHFSTTCSNTLNRTNIINVVDVVGDGESAIKSYFNNKPDVFLLDLGLPKLNGLDVLNRLESNIEEKKFCNVIIVTGSFFLKFKLTDIAKVYKVCLKPCNYDDVIKLICELYEFNNRDNCYKTNEIKNILFKLNLSPSIAGSRYLTDVINIYCQSLNEPFKLKKAYTEIAKKYSISPSSVEWNVDFAVKSINRYSTQKDILNVLPYYNKPNLTVKDLVTLVGDTIEINNLSL